MAFHKKLNQEHVPSQFQEIVVQLEEFPPPVAQTLLTETPFNRHWIAPGPWK
ncbi:hypothetical protein [Desulfogranum marinum]|uniref:hypothetical protein n=1 Tax=Desulfogranum marinum TaxID=453220 RepID=UPI0029C8664A|nr:hypothetical protein [Desulfogranum marinum]